MKSVSDEAERVLALMLDERRRDLYFGQDGNWYLTYGGGAVAERVKDHLVATDAIRPKYRDKDHTFTAGRTIDFDATVEARKAKRIGRSAVIYADAE